MMHKEEQLEALHKFLEDWDPAFRERNLGGGRKWHLL